MSSTRTLTVSSNADVFRYMKKLAVLLPLLLVGGAAAVGLSWTGQKHSPAIVAPPAETPALPKGRIAVTPAQLHEAYSAGLVDQPIRSILDVRRPMSYGDFIWNDAGVPAGPVWIRVDLHAQLMSVFRSGHEIGTAVILYGADGLPTPTGKFPILAKLKDHVSVTYGNAPMPYTLRLTRDGVSIHGSNVRWGFATHGCVGIPKAFAARVFGLVKTGDEVFITSGQPRRRKA